MLTIFVEKSTRGTAHTHYLHGYFHCKFKGYHLACVCEPSEIKLGRIVTNFVKLFIRTVGWGVVVQAGWDIWADSVACVCAVGISISIEVYGWVKVVVCKGGTTFGGANVPSWG